MTAFTESVVEDAALAWIESLGYTIKHGPEIALGELLAERMDYGQVVLAARGQAVNAKNATTRKKAMCKKCILVFRTGHSARANSC